MSQLEAVLFDLAGTLMVPRTAEELVAGAAERLRLELAEEEVARLGAAYRDAGIPGGPYPDHVPESLIELYARRDLSAQAHREAYVGLLSQVHSPDPRLPEAVYEQVLVAEGWILYADAKDVVDRLAARGLGLGLISNIGFDPRPILRRHGLARLAEHCTLSFEVQAIKPDPRIFAAALRDLGTEPDRTLMVGDHETADGGAAQVGMQTLILPMTEPGGVHGLDAVLTAVAGA